MPTVWFSLKRSLHCKSEARDVHDPRSRRKHLSTILTRKGGEGRSGCSRSLSNLRDVINGSKRHMVHKPTTCSPRSIGSSEFLNPIAHEVILTNSKCELKISGFGGDGTPRPVGGHQTMHYFNPAFQTSVKSTPRKLPSSVSDKEGSCVFGGNSGSRVPLEGDSNWVSSVTCHKCGEQFSKMEAAENHHLSKHAVTELLEGDSSRKIVEIICRSSWLKRNENQCGRIERVLKVHNMQKTVAQFEEYREMVKIKASKLPKKHPRCLADGNELLRFYGTTLGCCLGLNGCSSLCTSNKCSVCEIIRNGFSSKKELKEGIGVFTTSTSGKAFEAIENLEDNPSMRKALIVCRVIAGRVHRPLENIREICGQNGFDSLAGIVGLYANIEELYLLNPKALLPCFVVICKP